ncbi:glycosyltransferase [Mesobacillus jeotgali]|uniref:glycosyltransferase n=1 Tax=Mesobacillus jeotgali TaxID=129985 RepID=UPI00177B5D68|nr:glycosyltransferase [Mesobacillus jeotgali]UYZ21799.1 glycosyltransferase [Mesobacillus jeotgali]
MKRLLWIGSLESEEEFKWKANKGFNLASAQVSQENILLGLEDITGLTFDSINGSVLPPFPLYEDRIVEEVRWAHKENASNVSVGYRNEKFINRLTCKHSMIQAARKWVKEKYNNEELIVFAYSMRTPVMATACEIKKMIPSAKIFLIITDLPQFMDLKQSKTKAFLKRLDWLQIRQMQKQFDGFILYSSKMAQFLQLPDDKWILMEGLYDPSEYPCLLQRTNSHSKAPKAIMYSGKLDLQYGLDLLINAFMKIDNAEYELWFTGGGNAEDFIKESSLKDPRIKFYGFLPSRQDVINKQMEASLLVNMRLPSEAASAFCFPSKLFEYMATSIPVLSFKLEGIPQEYYNHLVIIEDETIESLIDSINKVLSMDNEFRLELGLSARDFILTNKNKDIQCGRIWDFCKERLR